MVNIYPVVALRFGPSINTKMDKTFDDFDVDPNEDSSKLFDKYSSRLNFEKSSTQYVEKARVMIENENSKKRAMRPGRDHRRTEEQVLDNRTKVVLFKFLDRKILGNINGCISTGKEGNIYIGTRGENAPADWPQTFAVKIFKTCILKFKDRERYVFGEMRFKNHGTSKNSRKAVILWAEKEYRNLMRLNKEGILAPKPLLVKENIIFMELITEKGLPAPILKNAHLNEKEYDGMYVDLCKTLRKMYHKCSLIHADLSEYNILVSMKNFFIIDVGQSVERDNNNATVFLRNDIAVITRFFKSIGIKTAPHMKLFEFIVEPNLIADEDWVLKELRDIDEYMSVEEFVGVYIPQRLDEVNDPDLEVMDIEEGIIDVAALHGAITGIIKSELAKENLDDLDDLDGYYDEEEGIYEEEEINQNEEEEEEKKKKDTTLMRSNFTKEEWKNIQKQIKQDKREKRKEKTPKFIKKRNYRKAHPNSK